MANTRRKQTLRRQQRAARMKLRSERRAGLIRPPTIEPGEQVYITERGFCFHPGWCTSMNGVWLEGHDVRVVAVDAIPAGRNLCGYCEADALGLGEVA